MNETGMSMYAALYLFFICTLFQNFNMKKYLVFLPAAIAAVVSICAFADTTSTLTVLGSVVNATCQVTTVTGNQTIALPQLTNFDAIMANRTGGQVVPFQVALSGCTDSANSSVAEAFDFLPAVGYDDIVKNSGTATEVDVRVFDSQKTPVSMAGKFHHITPKAQVNGNILFDLEAQYTSSVSSLHPGTVTASTIIGIFYP